MTLTLYPEGDDQILFSMVDYLSAHVKTDAGMF